MDNQQNSQSNPLTRRGFIQTSACTSGALAWLASGGTALGQVDNRDKQTKPAATGPAVPNELPSLAPARWLWYPSERCLQNTFVLFRRELELPARPRRATGWIAADSRYLLSVNGRRIQWGPAPCDPRWLEADPVNLTDMLDEGRNIIASQVLFYGQGDGTWPLGKPGFLFRLEIENADGSKTCVVSDPAWQAYLARAWRPGQHKRWYLRALQEEFDARLYPYGWTTADFAPNEDWLQAMVLDCPADKPPICSTFPEYMLEIAGDRTTSALRARSIPMLREERVAAAKLAESCWIEWKRPPQEYFECCVPNAFVADRTPSAREIAPGRWQVEMDGRRSAALTFEFQEQAVGWPYFSIEAPAGTVIELMVHEAHAVGGPALLNTHFHSWSRFICKEGANRFETFDYESLRWLQLHIREARGRVVVHDVGLRRRIFPWPHSPQIECGEPALQRLMDASINTLNNCAQETLVDGMARERQQYSGDCGHQLHAIYAAFGETRLPARYLTAFSQGMTLDGYFLDCWPAYDRLARLMERQLHLTGWGPILDHGIGFVLDCWYHYLYTGQLEALKEPYPRLLRFAEYLRSIQAEDGLLPAENIGIPSVWIDHEAYRQQRHKQCAFNLYAAAMLSHALAPICRAFDDPQRAAESEAFASQILKSAVTRFWSEQHGLFVNNLPWISQEKGIRLCDRSLATSILFDQCPGGRTGPAIQALATCPAEMGLSYPANAGWRLWALAAGGRADVILADLRQRWATMGSVRLNNTLQEIWNAHPDGGSQWSHCPLAPLYVMYMSIAGIWPTAPGFARCDIRPQLADLKDLHLTVQTVRGPLEFRSQGLAGDRAITITLPPTCEGQLLLAMKEQVPLDRLGEEASAGVARYRLPAGRAVRLHLKHT